MQSWYLNCILLQKSTICIELMIINYPDRSSHQYSFYGHNGNCLEVLWKFSPHVYKIHETKLWRMDRNRDFKVELSPSKKKKKSFIYFNESPLINMKNAFYFVLKILFVLRIFKFLSWGKNDLIRKIRLISKFMTSQRG